jgi:uncharacterized damage-inducible protein DinB
MKTKLVHYLQLWKLEGLSDYDTRRPMVRTGTNLLGLVKHVAAVESTYFGEVFGRPFPEKYPWMALDAETNSDMWATPAESQESVTSLYRRVWAHSDATIAALDLDAPGYVSWWQADLREVSLHQILIHVVAETQRHAGHADILRELIDGDAGQRRDDPNISASYDWDVHRALLEQAARAAGAVRNTSLNTIRLVD